MLIRNEGLESEWKGRRQKNKTHRQFQHYTNVDKKARFSNSFETLLKMTYLSGQCLLLRIFWYGINCLLIKLL
jgi:hypothetical protein